MIIIDEKVKLKEETIISIGKFDGSHIGHQKIFSKMREIAKERKLKKLIFTFDRNPNTNLGDEFKNINVSREKHLRLKNEGIDYIAQYNFDESLLKMSGEDFLRKILIDKLSMKVLVAGEDLAFGYQKSGNVELLKTLSKELDFDFYIIKKEKTLDNKEISSSLIRELIKTGKIKEANALMKSEYCIAGIVEEGNRIGKKLIEYPTANIFPEKDKILPLFGVYKTKLEILRTGEIFDAITNVGDNPTIKEDKKKHVPRIESHIFGLNKDLYKEKIRVHFLDFLRKQEKFESILDLKYQIEKDIDKLREDKNK